jgi:dihydroflavonol-4-reductase
VRALVTGAGGFVGSALARVLVAAGHEVRALLRASSAARALEGVAVERVRGDVLDPGSLQAAARGCDVVFHAAATFAYWGHGADELRALAVDGSRNAVAAAAAAGARRVVVTSSSVALGSSTRTAPRDERDRIADDEPAPAYFHAKAAGERAALEEGRARGVEVVAVLPTIVVGPHDWKLVPSNEILVNYLADPLRTTIPGGCNVVHVEDVARAHLLAAERGEPFARYVAGSENLEWALLHRIVAELAGVRPPLLHATRSGSFVAAAAMEAAAALTRRPPKFTLGQARTVGRFYWVRHDRLAALGWTPRPARAALADALAWLLASPHVSRALRATLRPGPEVFAARLAAERAG